MRKLICADLHLGINTDNFFIKGKGMSRLQEQERILMDMIEYMAGNNIKKWVIAGDIYHRNNPLPLYEAMFIRILNHAWNTGIEIDILLGNHDDSMSSVSALEPIIEAFCGEDSRVHVYLEPEVVDDCIYVPHCSKFDMDKYKNKVIDLANKHKPDYLIGHFHAIGAISGSEQAMLAGGELTINEFPSCIKRAILGHIHKPQEFRVGNTVVNYTGSISRVDFGERDDKKSFLVHDEEKDTIERIPIKCIEYKQIKLIESEVDKYDWEQDFSKVVVKVVIEEAEGKYSISDIEKKLGKVYLIRSISIIKKRKAIVRNKEVPSLAPTKALEHYFAGHKDKKEIILEGRAILEEVV